MLAIFLTIMLIIATAMFIFPVSKELLSFKAGLESLVEKCFFRLIDYQILKHKSENIDLNGFAEFCSIFWAVDNPSNGEGVFMSLKQLHCANKSCSRNHLHMVAESSKHFQTMIRFALYRCKTTTCKSLGFAKAQVGFRYTFRFVWYS